MERPSGTRTTAFKDKTRACQASTQWGGSRRARWAAAAFFLYVCGRAPIRLWGGSIRRSCKYGGREGAREERGGGFPSGRRRCGG
eukprot:364444-Chlamydomonas_euryale.AAC.18